jgi:hypothetical protein
MRPHPLTNALMDGRRFEERVMDSEKIEAFFAETTNAFHFLETEYGYRPPERVTRDLEYVKDARASVHYVSSHVGIEVEWAFADNRIAVYFTELLQSGVLPASSSQYPFRDGSNTAKVISLYTLAAVLGHSDDPDFLLKKVNSSRTANKRRKIIETRMPDVLAGLAHATQTYARPILQGDTTIFPKVMQFYVEEHKRDFPYSSLPSGVVDDSS